MRREGTRRKQGAEPKQKHEPSQRKSIKKRGAEGVRSQESSPSKSKQRQQQVDAKRLLSSLLHALAFVCLIFKIEITASLARTTCTTEIAPLFFQTRCRGCHPSIVSCWYASQVLQDLVSSPSLESSWWSPYEVCASVLCQPLVKLDGHQKRKYGF